MILAAATFVVFFIAFSQFFTASPATRWIGRVVAILGIVSGLCFVGVAATPWDLYLTAHNLFVKWAFYGFLAAVLLCLIAILLTPGFPRRFAWIFGVFALLLAGYVLLITLGPPANTPEGAAVQATGQKIIVYSSIITVLIQSLSVYSLTRTQTPSGRLTPQA